MTDINDPDRIMKLDWLPEGTTLGEYDPARVDAIRVTCDEFGHDPEFSSVKPDGFGQRVRELTAQYINEGRQERKG
jgi:hypothetical protein